MISIRELIKENDQPDADATLNLCHLHHHLNFLRRMTPFEWVIVRGFSTPEEQIRIYQEKGQPPKMGSQHLIGGAADIQDLNGSRQRWILEHLSLIEDRMLFLESFGSTPTWVHLQIFPYASWVPGKSHFFVP